MQPKIQRDVCWDAVQRRRGRIDQLSGARIVNREPRQVMMEILGDRAKGHRHVLCRRASRCQGTRVGSGEITYDRVEIQDCRVRAGREVIFRDRPVVAAKGYAVNDVGVHLTERRFAIEPEDQPAIARARHARSPHRVRIE